MATSRAGESSQVYCALIASVLLVLVDRAQADQTGMGNVAAVLDGVG